MKTILAPVDFSPAADRVVAEAIALARPLDARVVLLHVTEPSVGVLDYAIVALSVATVDEAKVKRAIARLGALEAHLKSWQVTVETRHLVGSPVNEILTQALVDAADYLVIGSHGHGAIYDVLVGSTTTGVLKRAPCPVLVVPARMPLRAPEIVAPEQKDGA